MKIYTETLDDLKNSGVLIDSINEAVIGVELSKEAVLEKIFNMIVQNNCIKVLYINDDYLHPDDRVTQYFVDKVKRVSPWLMLHWVRACVIDGWYGR